MKGQAYRISDPVATTDETVPTEGAPTDLVVLTAAAAVPFYLPYLQVNCGVNAAQIQKVSVVYRTSGGSGAAGSLGIRNTSPAGPASSTTANFLVTTPGSISGVPMWCEDWQQFGGFEYDQRDDAELVPAGLSFAVEMPSVAAGFTCNVNAYTVEFK